MTGSPDKWYGVSDVSTQGCYCGSRVLCAVGARCFVQMGDVDVIVGIQNRSHIVEYVEEAAAEKKTLNAVGDIMAVTDFGKPFC